MRTVNQPTIAGDQERVDAPIKPYGGHPIRHMALLDGAQIR